MRSYYTRAFIVFTAHIVLLNAAIAFAQSDIELEPPSLPRAIDAESAAPLPPVDFAEDLDGESEPESEPAPLRQAQVLPTPVQIGPQYGEAELSDETKTYDMESVEISDAAIVGPQADEVDDGLPPFAFDAPPTRPKKSVSGLPLAAQAQAGFATAIPILSVETSGPPEALVNQPGTYRVKVSNLGETIAQQVVVDVSLPESARDVQTAPKCQALGPSRLRFRLGDIGEKQHQTLQIKLTPARRGDVQLHTEVSMAAATALAVTVREAKVELKAAGPSQAGFGQKIVHKVIVKNVGDAAADGLVINQILPEKVTEVAHEGMMKEIGYLAPGESREIYFAAAAQTTGDITIGFEINGSPSITTEVNRRVEILRPLIEVTTQGPSLNYVDREGIYAILITNPGDAAAQNVEIATAIPEGIQVLAIDRAAKYSRSNGTLTWTIDSLASGNHEVFRFKAKAVKEGRHVHDILVRGEGGLVAKARHLTEVISRADVSMQIADTPGPIEVGSPALFEVLVRNRGTKEAKNVSVAVDLPISLEAVRSREYSVKNNQITFPVITLPAGTQKVFRFEAVGGSNGDHVVKVMLRSDSLPRVVTAEESIFFYESRSRRIATRPEEDE